MIRQVLTFKDNFIRFYESQDIKTQLKIEYTLDLIRYEESIPEKFFKNLLALMEFMKSE